MRLRKKQWARPYIEESPYAVLNPELNKGKWQNIFQNGNAIELELGVGRGTFIYSKAIQNKNVNYVGIELKDEVIIYGLKKITEENIENVRLVPMNIMHIENIFSKDEISKIYINFCNPWPKERHKKRRLTHPAFLILYKEFLRSQGEVWFKTDDTDLFNDSIEYFINSGFEISYKTYDLHNSDFKENIVTEYENKFTKLGMKTMFLTAKLK
jgi:tRNA (guanine-N7-)-methyltransferase